MKLTVDFHAVPAKINPAIYGHFSEMLGGVFYDGLWVG